MKISRKPHAGDSLASCKIHNSGITADRWPQLRINQFNYKLVLCFLKHLHICQSFCSTLVFSSIYFRAYLFSKKIPFSSMFASTERAPKSRIFCGKMDLLLILNYPKITSPFYKTKSVLKNLNRFSRKDSSSTSILFSHLGFLQYEYIVFPSGLQTQKKTSRLFFLEHVVVYVV